MPIVSNWVGLGVLRVGLLLRVLRGVAYAVWGLVYGVGSSVGNWIILLLILVYSYWVIVIVRIALAVRLVLSGG